MNKSYILAKYIPYSNSPSSFKQYVIKSFLTYSGSDYISFKNALLEVFDKEITGVVWEDFNFDGIMDSDESKISTVSLKLYNSSDELLQTTTPDDKGKYERLLAVVKKDDAENSKYRKEIASLNLKINEKTWIANNAQKELDDFKEQTKATMEQLTQRIRTNQETTDKEIAEYKAALAKKDQEINELREELGNNY